MMQKLARGVALAAIVIGIGVAPAASIQAAPVAAQQPAAPSRLAGIPVVVLNNASDSTTVTAEKGEVIVVALTGSLQWSTAFTFPRTSQVLLPLGGVTLPNGSSLTMFSVVNSGEVQLQATGGPVCTGPTPCPLFRELWRATVIVPVAGPLTPRLARPHRGRDPATGQRSPSR